MRDIPGLIERAIENHNQHLERESLLDLTAYLVGYEMACRLHFLPVPHDPLDPTDFQQWLNNRIEMTREHESRLNARSCISPEGYAMLHAKDEREALAVYKKIRQQALNDLGPTQENDGDVPSRTQDVDFLAVINNVVKRPAMYFGNYTRISDLQNYLNGFFWCERDHGIERSELQVLTDGFQGWIEKRYPFSRGVPWHRTLHFLCSTQPHHGFESFSKHFEMYHNGDPHDAPDPWMQQMIDNIIKNHPPSNDQPKSNSP